MQIKFCNIFSIQISSLYVQKCSLYCIIQFGYFSLSALPPDQSIPQLVRKYYSLFFRGSLGPSLLMCLLESAKEWHEFGLLLSCCSKCQYCVALQKCLVIIILTQYFALLLLPFPCHDNVLWIFFSPFTLSSLNCSIKVSTLATQTKSFLSLH